LFRLANKPLEMCACEKHRTLGLLPTLLDDHEGRNLITQPILNDD
jgi:hypothetical protein